MQDNTAKSNAIFDVTQHGASGSSRNALGSVARGEVGLKLDAAVDFKNGDGIKIEHAGTACALKGMACPLGPKPVVIVEGSLGSTTYTYQLAVINERGGVGPAGPAVTITDGPSVVSTRLYNLIRWEAIPAASGYALYRNNRLLLVLSGLTPLRVYKSGRFSRYRDFEPYSLRFGSIRVFHDPTEKSYLRHWFVRAALRA